MTDTCNLSKDEFLHRVAHNTAVLIEAFQEGLPVNCILHKLYAYDAVPGERHSVELSRKIDDIFPALILGHLPIFKTDGADGWRINGFDGDTFTHVEYKMCLFDPENIAIGPLGGLRMEHNGDSKPTGITSAISAKYNVCTEDIIHSKARDTYFILIDRTRPENELIDVLMLTSEKIVPQLLNKTGKNRAISLACFLNEGESSSTMYPFKKQTWAGFKQQLALDSQSATC